MAGTSGKELKQFTAADYKVRVCQAMNFISQNLERGPSLEEVAEVALFSKFHFHRIFKAVTGETVAGFTRRLRLERAATRLLANPLEDITAVAINCGFSSSQNFAKAFRQQFSCSPTEFRTSKIGNKFSNCENALSLNVAYDFETEFLNQPNTDRTDVVKAEVRELPERTVAYVRKMGAYGKETCEMAFGELRQWVGRHGFAHESSMMMALYWDHPEVTPADKCRVDACVEVPLGTKVDCPVDLQTIAGGRYLVCTFESAGDRFQRSWDDSFAYVVSSGLELDDKPSYELYHDQGGGKTDGRWKFDICIPLKLSS